MLYRYPTVLRYSVLQCFVLLIPPFSPRTDGWTDRKTEHGIRHVPTGRRPDTLYPTKGRVRWTDGQTDRQTERQRNSIGNNRPLTLYLQRGLIITRNTKVIWEEAALPPLTAAAHSRSAVLVRWRLCGPYLTHGSLDPPDLSPQTASRSTQPFFYNICSLPTDRLTDRPTDKTDTKLDLNNRPLYGVI